MKFSSEMPAIIEIVSFFVTLRLLHHKHLRTIFGLDVKQNDPDLVLNADGLVQ